MQLRTNIIRNIFVLALVIGACTSCDNDFMQMEAPNNKGVLRLQMSSNQHYIDIETRATLSQNELANYKFTLNTGQELDFTNGSAILEAGSYTLSATNATEQYTAYSGPIYSGSVNFTLSAGEQKTVTLDLGKPKNAKVTVALSEEFSAKYTLGSMTIANGSAILTSSETTAFVPAGVDLSYTLVANAKQGSHVQDITSATGTINISAGNHTTITLKVNPINPNLVYIVSGADHNGEFQ